MVGVVGQLLSYRIRDTTSVQNAHRKCIYSVSGGNEAGGGRGRIQSVLVHLDMRAGGGRGGR